MFECNLRHEFAESLRGVERWVEDHDYKGWEPFDGLSSYLRPLTFGNLFLERILLQTVRRSPVNLRPLLGIRPADSTIARGYMAWGYLIMLKAGSDGIYGRKAKSCLNWLIENKSPGFDHFSWGKHFDFASRGGTYPKFEPITVWTSLVGMAFLEAYEIFKENVYLEIAESICSWIMKLTRNVTNTGVCISYTGSGIGECTIHNHSMLAAAMLARTAKHTNNPQYIELAKAAMEYSCSRQLPDGSWYYGEDPKYHWIDNFHTGYNLDSIKYFVESTDDKTYLDHLVRGLKYYISHFFEEGGRPKYYHNQTYPVDSQCISQSIDTLTNCADIEPAALNLAVKVARWAISNMQDREGFFYFREYRLVKDKTPMLHWAQTTMYKALASLIERINTLGF